MILCGMKDTFVIFQLRISKNENKNIYKVATFQSFYR